jgi:hypothetical protein
MQHDDATKRACDAIFHSTQALHQIMPLLILLILSKPWTHSAARMTLRTVKRQSKRRLVSHQCLGPFVCSHHYHSPRGPPHLLALGKCRMMTGASTSSICQCALCLHKIIGQVDSANRSNIYYPLYLKYTL